MSFFKTNQNPASSSLYVPQEDLNQKRKKKTQSYGVDVFSSDDLPSQSGEAVLANEQAFFSLQSVVEHGREEEEEAFHGGRSGWRCLG